MTYAQKPLRRFSRNDLLLFLLVIDVITLPRATGRDSPYMQISQNLNHLIFKRDTLSEFYNCLCQPNTRLCTQRYFQKTQQPALAGVWFIARGKARFEIDTELEGDYFQCRLGSFDSAGGEFSCRRISHASLACLQDIGCHKFHINFDSDVCGSCTTHCINIILVGNNVKIDIFGRSQDNPLPDLSPGKCKSEPAVVSTVPNLSSASVRTNITFSTQPGIENSTESSAFAKGATTGDPLSNTMEDTSLSVVAILGLVLALVFIVGLIALFVVLHRRHKANRKKDDSARYEPNHGFPSGLQYDNPNLPPTQRLLADIVAEQQNQTKFPGDKHASVLSDQYCEVGSLQNAQEDTTRTRFADGTAKNTYANHDVRDKMGSQTDEAESLEYTEAWRGAPPMPDANSPGGRIGEMKEAEAEEEEENTYTKLTAGKGGHEPNTSDTSCLAIYNVASPAVPRSSHHGVTVQGHAEGPYATLHAEDSPRNQDADADIAQETYGSVSASREWRRTLDLADQSDYINAPVM